METKTRIRAGSLLFSAMLLSLMAVGSFTASSTTKASTVITVCVPGTTNPGLCVSTANPTSWEYMGGNAPYLWICTSTATTASCVGIIHHGPLPSI